MRIILEPSEYHLEDNVGHVVMTHVAAARVSALWPSAAIEILTEPSALLSEFCPGCIAVLRHRPRSGAQSGFQAVLAQVPGTAQGLVILKNSLRRHSPSLFKILKRLKGRAKLPTRDYRSEERDAIRGADLMVVSGMGGVTETFRAYAFGLFDRIESALEAGIPVAMMGQGIGPLRDPELRARAAEVLSGVSLICLREGRASPSILTSLGIPPERILVTGDDAVEIAFLRRPERLGNSLGVNLRVARYSAIDLSLAPSFARLVQQAATNFNAELTPVPIDRDDVEPIKVVVGEYRKTEPVEYAASPIRAIESVGRCRALITGSYHAAVFALSMGIPTVCIACSDYYVDKFLGLGHQFGPGCEVVMLDRTDWPEKAAAAIAHAWRSAEQLRPELLGAAHKQVELGRAAYRAVYEMFPRWSPQYQHGIAPANAPADNHMR